MSLANPDMIRQLRQEILQLQGFERVSGEERLDLGLGEVERVFPNECFPLAAVHEFISNGAETTAATAGFIAGIGGKLMERGGACLWIGSNRMVNPSALVHYGIEADRVLFIDCKNDKQVLWAVEEALGCEGLAAVVGEVREVDFTASRRYQLAVEKSGVTGFLLRDRPRTLSTNACVARWKIEPLASEPPVPGMPGVGVPRWSVELLKVKNGQPGKWQVEWQAGRFHPLTPDIVMPVWHRERRRKAG